MTFFRSHVIASRLHITKVREKLFALYERGAADSEYKKLEGILVEHAESIRRKRFELTERDVAFVTYGDGFLNPMLSAGTAFGFEPLPP